MFDIKKLAAIAILAMACDQAMAATSTGSVQVNVVQSISITPQSGMVFGDVTSTSSGGKITLSPGGIRSVTGGVTVIAATPASAGSFDVNGESGAVFTITLSESVLLVGSSSSSMLVDNFISSPEIGTLDSSGQQSIFIGARLNIGSNQPYGSYSQVMSVTVEYN